MYTATNHSFQFKCQIKSRQTLPCSTLPPALGWALWPFPKPPIAWHSPKPSPRGHLQPQLPIPSARCPVSTLPIKETKDFLHKGARCQAAKSHPQQTSGEAGAPLGTQLAPHRGRMLAGMLCGHG